MVDQAAGGTSAEETGFGIVAVPDEHADAILAYVETLQSGQDPDVEGYIAPTRVGSLGGGSLRPGIGTSSVAHTGCTMSPDKKNWICTD